MRAYSFGAVCGAMVVGLLTGCQTRERVPDYLPREVVANQVGNAVVYQTNDPRLAGATNAAVAPGIATPARRSLYGQPEGVSVSDKGLREATLIWALPQEEVYSYRIERAESPSGPFVKIAELSPRKLQYRDNGTPEAPLKDDSTYYYQIVAVLERDGQESIPSKLVQARTAPPPLPPPEVRASASSSRAATLTWLNSPSDGVTSYRIERAPAVAPGTYERVGQVRSTSWVDGGTPQSVLKDSTRYLYRVITINRVMSESSPSAPVEMTTLPPPAIVRNVAAVSDEVRCVPLSWAQSPEPDIVRYDVYRGRAATGPFEQIGSAPGRTVLSYLDGGANPGTLEDEAVYFYRIRAVNDVTAESAASEVARAVTRGVPPEVENVTLVGNRPREIPVSWSANPDKAVQGYEIWRAEEGGDEWIQLARLTGRDSTNYLDRGESRPRSGLGQLRDAAVYHYKVIAFNQANVRSSASAPVNARTKYRPVAPAGLQVTTNLPLSIRMTWKANPEKDIASYVVECNDSASDSFRKLVAVPAAREGGLAACEMALDSGTVRYYRVKAVDRDGLESDWSAVGYGRAKPVPDAPGSVQAKPEGTNVRVTWQAPVQKDVRRYKVWRKKLFGWELVSATEQTSYLFEFTELSKPLTIAVSAVDKDELESDRSGSLEIKPGM